MYSTLRRKGRDTFTFHTLSSSGPGPRSATGQVQQEQLIAKRPGPLSDKKPPTFFIKQALLCR